MLLDADNCGDTYQTSDIPLVGWTNNAAIEVIAGDGRAGGAAMVARPGGFQARQFARVVSPSGSSRHLFNGFGYRLVNQQIYDVVSIHDPNGVQHLTLGINASGVMTMYRGANGGTVLGTCSVAMPSNQFKYIEVEAFIDDASGVARVWVDDVLALDYIGDTRNGGLALWGILSYVNNGTNHSPDVRYDDWYLCDDQGLPPWNTRLSDVSVLPHYPTGPGNSATWTRGGTDSGANWSQVDEGSPNGDADYVTAVLQGKQDLYTFQALKAPGHSILGVQSVMHARKVDAGTATVGCSFRHAGVDYAPASGLPLGLDYRYLRQMFQSNPGGGAWSESAFNAIQAGPYKNS